MFGGQVPRQVAEVPLADHARGVAGRLEQFGDGDFRCWQPSCGIREKHSSFGRHHAIADRQPSREQGGAARCADAGTDVEAGPSLALLCHAVEVWRADGGVAVATQIAVAEIVTENHHDVRFGSGYEWQAETGERDEDVWQSFHDFFNAQGKAGWCAGSRMIVPDLGVGYASLASGHAPEFPAEGEGFGPLGGETEGGTEKQCTGGGLPWVERAT